MTLPRTLSCNEAMVLAALEAAAEAGAQCPRNEHLEALIDANSSSTATSIVKRLEGWGLIRVERWQRARRVTIVATGKATAEVRTRAVHWRHRPNSLPGPAPAPVKARNPDGFAEIMAAANREERPIAEFLTDLVWMGWGAYREDSGMV